ncbi:DUF6098 family protein [Allonocardiopsis opalescens]|uniref:Uncharacterized protein n=1 Tax=Allonocardiopsis opalescens TaxID=1144618 RepID=A0A2T0QAN8_9ACTN|nr:DUF6098 family protein [Allonocardiopsis opalescens]PRY00872.1 hypothetical protein CLV72_102504 [Allonocardiopsis opalescens]
MSGRPGTGGTDAELPVLTTMEELLAEVARPEEVYVRHSKGPEHDAARTSVDYESGVRLPGLSVNPLSPPSWWTRPPADWVARQVRSYAHLTGETGNRTWLLFGRVIGRGPDNEPLVDRVQPLAWLHDELLITARRWYEARFDVGRATAG